MLGSSSHESISSKPELNVYFDISYTENHIVPNHWHNHLELLYILEGAMHIKCNERAYVLKPREFFVFNSGDIHYTRSEKETRVILLQVPYEFLQRVLPDYDEISFKQYFSKRKMEESDTLKQIEEHLLRMKRVYEQGEPGYALLFGSDLNQVLYLLYKNHSIRGKNATKNEDRQLNRLKEIITYIEIHYVEPLSLTDTAKTFAMNPEYFCRYFKKNLGFTFLEYVNMVRLSHIYEDLLHSEQGIFEIQERHGFTNNKLFHRMFREMYGCTPSEARKRGNEQI